MKLLQPNQKALSGIFSTKSFHRGSVHGFNAVDVGDCITLRQGSSVIQVKVVEKEPPRSFTVELI